jgi:hypothetical protein
MPMDIISMCSNTMYMYNVDAVSSLSWLSATSFDGSGCKGMGQGSRDSQVPQ